MSVICNVQSNRAGQSESKMIVPGPILLLGAPGVGKGNPGQGTGQIVGHPADFHRRPVARQCGPGNAAGQVAKEIMGRGELVPDSLVNEMVAVQAAGARHGQRLHSGRVSRGRWGRRAGWTAVWRRNRRRSPVVAVSIQVDYNQFLRRITGRRNCPVCQTIYNVYSNPPQTGWFL